MFVHAFGFSVSLWGFLELFTGMKVFLIALGLYGFSRRLASPLGKGIVVAGYVCLFNIIIECFRLADYCIVL